MKSNKNTAYNKVSHVLAEKVVDVAASIEFILPRESKLAKELLKKYDFTDHQRERYTIGDASTSFEKNGWLPLVKLGALEFNNVKVTIGKSKKTRIGISFFNDCQLYIDNANKSYKIKKLEKISK